VYKIVIFFIVMVASIPSTWAEQGDLDYPWLDRMHENIADSADSTALWFDDFFALDEFEHEDKASGEARIKLGWEPRSREFNEFETRLKLRVKLPNLKNRVDLVLSDYDDEQPDSAIIASGNDAFNNQERFSLALRWRAKPNSGLSHRIGIGRRLQPFVKSRYRSLIKVSEKTDLRWETAVYYYSRDGFGAHISGLVDYSLSPESLFRFNNNFYYRDRSKDWLWQHSWQNLKQLDDKSALIYGFYIEGASQPNYRIEEYLVSTRWRKNALREWLFYEVEPFILWRRDENFVASFGLALRIEGFFGHN
jgi:hypothetical protein